MRQTPLRLLLICGLLVGCATESRVIGTGDWQTHQQQLTALVDWRASGRVALSSPGRSESARLTWIQQAQDIELTLSGPVGIKQATLSRRDGTLVLMRNGRRETLEDVDAALAAEFGWTLPLNHLPWWLRGLPAPNIEPSEVVLDRGLLKTLHQDGWQLEYLEYQNVNGRQLPRSLRFRRDQLQGKLLLKQWTVRS